MDGYTLLGLKLAMGIIGLVLQINLMGKGNLAPTSAMDQVQNYVLGGMILNIRDQYFEVHFNNDFSAYTLSPINLVNPNVTVIDKEDK